MKFIFEKDLRDLVEEVKRGRDDDLTFLAIRTSFLENNGWIFEVRDVREVVQIQTDRDRGMARVFKKLDVLVNFAEKNGVKKIKVLI